MRRMEHTTGSRVADLIRLASMLLLSVLTTLAVVSCGGSGDEPGGDPAPVPNEPMPIVFSGSLSEGESESHARTRTTTNPLSATHQAFHVWAYKNPASGSTETVMRDYTVNYVSGSAGTTTSNSSGWEYVNQGTQQSIKYWDFKAENLNDGMKWGFILLDDKEAAELFDNYVKQLKRLLEKAEAKNIDTADERAVYNNFESTQQEVIDAIESLKRKMGYIEFADTRAKSIATNNWDEDDD